MKKRTVGKAPRAAKTGKVVKAAKVGGKDVNLDVVFDELERILAAYAPPFKATGGRVREKRDYHLTVPIPVVIAGAYGGKPTPVAMASLILQKGYVGFYYMPVYMVPGLKQKLAPELVELLKGKSCFYVKELTPELRAGIREAVEIGTECFRDKGWV
jgi:hypothetical protein